MANANEAKMSSPSDRVSRPWRRFLRFSVRGLILTVTVLGAGLGWIVRQAHIQRDAVAAIQEAGGSVTYDWEFDNGKYLPGGKPWAPSWLVDLIGVDFFDRVTLVNLSQAPRPPDSVLAEVGRLNQLEILELAGNASVTDAGLVHLKGLTNLSGLGLNNTQITDAGLVHMKGLTKLSYLGLNGTQVTDAGLVRLKGLTNLSILGLNGSQVTDAGMVHLKGLTNVSHLGLSGTQFTDAGLVHLKGLTHLSELGLNNTRVTDAGLVHLKGLTHLSVLWLNSTQVTDAGMNELKRTLPGLSIHHPLAR
jgi:Leucine-rich repeat (LRR) protein